MILTIIEKILKVIFRINFVLILLALLGAIACDVLGRNEISLQHCMIATSCMLVCYITSGLLWAKTNDVKEKRKLNQLNTVA